MNSAWRLRISTASGSERDFLQEVTLATARGTDSTLNQSVNPLGQFEILVGQSAHTVGHHAQADVVPAVDQNIGVMVQGFGFISDTVDEFHRAFEVLKLQIARQPIAISAPIREAGKGVLDLLFIKLHLNSPNIVR